MKIRFCGANRQVTGSCYVLETSRMRVGIDCGMYQERKFLERNWDPFPFDPASLDVLLLTHAHLDHCGLLPKLVRDGFRGPILTTPPSIELARLVLEDAARIQLEDVLYKKRRHKKEGRKSKHKYEPLYTSADVDRVLPLMRPVSYDEPVDLGDGVTVTYLEAGHILGSALLALDVAERGTTRRTVFSGDLGQWDVPIVGDPTYVERADHVVLESTYGDRDHDPPKSVALQLADVINDTRRRGGHVIIPTFALERAQEVLLHLAQNIEDGTMAGLDIFLDSPMAINATEIFLRHPEYMEPETRDALQHKRLGFASRWVRATRSIDESKTINAQTKPSVILAGSGMCTGGRVKHHLSWNLSRPESTVLFVGYQSEDTLGRQILDGASEVRIFGRRLPVKARLEQIQGLSAHAGRSDLLRWLGKLEAPPRSVMLTHGEERAALSLAENVREQFGHAVSVPKYLDEVEL
ncbi:MAG: MBL fold metallo-hydrolase [bacterium]|nr:MBL fold metallo-hydrolase [bacterium]